MTAFFAMVLNRFGAWIAAVLAGLAMLATVFFAGRKAGKADEIEGRAEEKIKDNEAIAVKAIDAARAEAKAEVETVKGANDVQANINRLDSGNAGDRLRDKWARD